MYFVKDEFPEMEAFMEDVSRSHEFEFLKYPLSYKDGMRELVDSHGVKVRGLKSTLCCFAPEFVGLFSSFPLLANAIVVQYSGSFYMYIICSPSELCRGIRDMRNAPHVRYCCCKYLRRVSNAVEK